MSQDLRAAIRDEQIFHLHPDVVHLLDVHRGGRHIRPHLPRGEPPRVHGLARRRTVSTLTHSLHLIFMWFCFLRFSIIFCLFVPFFFDIPKLSSATFGGVSMSSKVLPYFAALHIISTSKANLIAGLSGIVSSFSYFTTSGRPP